MASPHKGGLETTLLRTAAVATAVGTIVFLFIGGDWRLGNLFLFPDLMVCAILLVGAFAPHRSMRVLLFAGFAVGVGVFSAANASYLVDGRFGIGAFIALLTCTVAGGWLLNSFLKAPAL